MVNTFVQEPMMPGTPSSPLDPTEQPGKCMAFPSTRFEKCKEILIKW